MKMTMRIFAALALLVGVIWILQGVNVLPGSFMTGDMAWAYRGAGLAAVGVVLLLLAQRMKSPGK